MSSILKEEARKNIINKKIDVIKCTILYITLSIFISFIFSDKNIYFEIINSFLTIIISYSYLKILINTIYDKFNIKNSIVSYKILIKGIISNLLSLSVMIFTLLLFFITIPFINDLNNTALSAIYYIVILLLFIYSISFFLNFSLVQYILIFEEKRKFSSVLKESKKLMKNRKMGYISITLSFILWIILILFISDLRIYLTPYISIILILLVVIYLVPYFTLTMFYFYNYVKNNSTN